MSDSSQTMTRGGEGAEIPCYNVQGINLYFNKWKFTLLIPARKDFKAKFNEVVALKGGIFLVISLEMETQESGTS